MRSKNLDTDSLLREAMRSAAAPDAELVRGLKNKLYKAESELSKIKVRHYFSAAALVAAIIIFTTTSAFAAWYFLKPSEVANQLNDPALSSAFEGDNALNINASVTSGEYTFTLLGVASGKNITDLPFYSDGELKSDRTYAVLAIKKADGAPIDKQSEEYLNTSFFVSPLIKGTNPALVNIITMNGAYSEIVKDGTIYRIIECDNVEMFADRGLYLAVCTGGPFYNHDAFAWNEQTGDIKANPGFAGASAVFDLPVDKNLADPLKAEQYLKELLSK